MKLLLAIDGGGSRTRCVAVEQDGRIAGRGESGPSNHLHVPASVAVASLRDATARALTSGGASSADVAGVCAGLAGVDVDGAGRTDAEDMLKALGFERLSVYGDMVIAHRGALAGGPGVVALAGTGSSVLGIAADGRQIKAGGWGPLYGDHGSAYQIGRLGLVAAAEAFDGAGPETALVARLSDALGVADFRETMTRVYANGAGQRQTAALAPIVDACASEGDEVAKEICVRAGRDLARLVLAVVRRLGGGVRVSYQGAVLERSAIVRRAFNDALAADGEGLDLRPPRLDALGGAVLLGAGQLGWHIDPGVLERNHGV